MEGLDNYSVAEQLSISTHTVKNHITNIYQKLHVKDRYQLMKCIYSK
ncbi:helix-turn-helix transcriptional regulator [Pseudomonas sp. 2822-15]